MFNSFSYRSSFRPNGVNNAFISVSVSATDDVVKVEVWDVVDKGEWRTKELHMLLCYSAKLLFPFRPPVLILSSLHICHTSGQKHPLLECAGEHCHRVWPLACVQWVALPPYTFVFRLFSALLVFVLYFSNTINISFRKFNSKKLILHKGEQKSDRCHSQKLLLEFCMWKSFKH